jgi:hypothetical protein
MASQMKDPYLVPFLLPNVFEISRGLSKEEFTAVLPKLQPLFALKDPPQNMLSQSYSQRPDLLIDTRSPAGALGPVRGENPTPNLPGE